MLEVVRAFTERVKAAPPEHRVENQKNFTNLVGYIADRTGEGKKWLSLKEAYRT